MESFRVSRRWIWRITGTLVGAPHPQWAAGVERHLGAQALTLRILHRAGAQRSYLLLDGCPQCGADGCTEGCHRSLCAHLVRTTLPGLQLTPVARLVADPTARRWVVARPSGVDAQPVVAALAATWPSWSLSLTWSHRRGPSGGLRVGLALAVPATGPAPVALLRTLGWASAPLVSQWWRWRGAHTEAASVPIAGPAGPALRALLADPVRLWGLEPAQAAPESAPPSLAARAVGAWKEGDTSVSQSHDPNARTSAC